MISQRLI